MFQCRIAERSFLRPLMPNENCWMMFLMHNIFRCCSSEIEREMFSTASFAHNVDQKHEMTMKNDVASGSLHIATTEICQQKGIRNSIGLSFHRVSIVFLTGWNLSLIQ
jgi:hypothetical protein